MAARVRFLVDYVYTPTAERRVSTKFKAGRKIVLVTEDCAEKAIAAGKAERVGEQPGRPPQRPVRKRSNRK